MSTQKHTDSIFKIIENNLNTGYDSFGWGLVESKMTTSDGFNKYGDIIINSKLMSVENGVKEYHDQVKSYRCEAYIFHNLKEINFPTFPKTMFSGENGSPFSGHAITHDKMVIFAVPPTCYLQVC